MNKLNILYEDNHLIVVVKPAGVLSQADNSNCEDMLTIIKAYLKEKYHKPGNVYLGLLHRLDKDVSGIMVFAKTSKAASRISEQIRDGIFQKNYYAVVEGIITKKEGLLEDKIEKIDNKQVFLNTPNGKIARLEYKVIGENNHLSLVDIHLLTGRYHQIRLQFSLRGYPLYGDSLYGSKYQNHIALFAYQIQFMHPVSKELLVFKAKPNIPIMNELLKQFTNS